MTAQHCKTALDGGAYGSYGVASTYYTGALQTTTYKLPDYQFDGVRAFTNKPPCGPKRGHGTPQPRFGFESISTRPRSSSRIDPAELRMRNLAEPDSITANWLQLGTIGLRRCIEAVVEGSGWKRALRQATAGRASDSPAAPTCAVPVCRSTGITCRSRAYSSTRSLRRRRRLLRPSRDRPGIRLGTGGDHAPRCWDRPGRHPALRRGHRSHSGRPG